jgi:hypothetical protein
VFPGEDDTAQVLRTHARLPFQSCGGHRRCSTGTQRRMAGVTSSVSCRVAETGDRGRMVRVLGREVAPPRRSWEASGVRCGEPATSGVNPGERTSEDGSLMIVSIGRRRMNKEAYQTS